MGHSLKPPVLSEALGSKYIDDLNGAGAGLNWHKIAANGFYARRDYF